MEETHSEIKTRIWSRVAKEHPEFTPQFDINDNPWEVENKILNNELGFIPFKGARVMDVGANAGVQTAYWALNGCDVTAYEADPETARLLNEMLVKGNLKVKVVNAAIWSSEGNLQFTALGFKSGMGHTFRNGHLLAQSKNVSCNTKTSSGEGSSLTCVSCISLTQAVGNDIWDFIKIDIEGAEWEVLSAIDPNTLAERVRFMQVELHDIRSGGLWTTFENEKKIFHRLGSAFTIVRNQYGAELKSKILKEGN